MGQFLVEWEHRRPAVDGDYAGSLTRGKIDELLAMDGDADDAA